MRFCVGTTQPQGPGILLRHEILQAASIAAFGEQPPFEGRTARHHKASTLGPRNLCDHGATSGSEHRLPEKPGLIEQMSHDPIGRQLPLVATPSL